MIMILVVIVSIVTITNGCLGSGRRSSSSVSPNSQSRDLFEFAPNPCSTHETLNPKPYWKGQGT